MNIIIVSLLFLFLLIFVDATSVSKPKYYSKHHEKLKSKQECHEIMHCGRTVIAHPLYAVVICIKPSPNTNQLVLSSSYKNFGAITVDITDGSYNENIFIAPGSTQYLTRYYGFDIQNYNPDDNIQIPLRIIPPAINISHDITIGCMECSRDICGETISSNKAQIKRICIPTHISANNPSYISQFSFKCNIGTCLVQVYDYMNELKFSANIGGKNEHIIEFNDFDIEEAYTIEYTGYGNESELEIGCYDPLFHTVNFNKQQSNYSNGNTMKNVQELVMLITMVAVLGLVIVSYIKEKYHMSRNTDGMWNDL